MLEEGLFFLKATEALSPETVSRVFLHRLCRIFTSLVEAPMSKSSLSDCASLLLRLLKYIGETSVFGLFNTLCSPSSSFLALQRALADARFANCVIQELDRNLSSEETLNMLSLICVCLKNPVFRSSFTCGAFVEQSLAYLNTADVFLLNQVWQALSLLVSECTLAEIASLKLNAITLLEDVSKLHMYHTFACDFLAQLIKLCPKTFSCEEKMRILSAVLALMDSFPNATNLIIALFRVIRAMVRSPQFLLFVMPSVFPYLIFEAQSSIRTAKSAISASFLCEVETSRKQSKVVDRFLSSSEQYRVFGSRFLRSYMHISNTSYGGPGLMNVKHTKSSDGAARSLKYTNID
jgi:hypothetical protein